MKKKIIITIETPETHSIVPEAGTDESEYEEAELEKFRENYAKQLDEKLLQCFDKEFIKNDIFEKLEEETVEDWDSLDDYGIKINVEIKDNEI